MGLRGLAVAAAAVLVLAGCGDSAGSHGSGGEQATGWPTSRTLLDPSGLVWAVGSVVHLADGTTLDVGEPIRSYVVGGSGIVFAAADADPGPAYGGYLESWPLSWSDGSGTARRVTAAAATPRTSPDGRYLAFLDLASGPKDGSGAAQAEAVVVDLESGTEVARSSASMGDPRADDLADLYSESDLGVVRVDDDVAYVHATDGDVLVIDLATGDVTTTDEAPDERPLPPDGDRRSPDGRWRIADADVYGDGPPHDHLVGAGRTLQPRSDADLLDLRWWVDDSTVAGIAVDGQVADGAYAPGSSAVLVTCVVPSGACAEVDGTRDEDVVLPEGTAEDSTLHLGP